jgi:hypothetical protein
MPSEKLSASARLSAAAATGDMQAIEELLPVAFLEAKDALGLTALMQAARAGHALAVERLLPLSNIDQTDLRGHSPLMVAAAANRLECCELLLARFDPRKANAHGRTALMEAAQTGAAEVVDLLLPLSDPLARTNSGIGVLSIAISSTCSHAPRIVASLCADPRLDDATRIEASGVAARKLIRADADSDAGQITGTCLATALATLPLEEVMAVVSVIPDLAAFPPLLACVERAQLARLVQAKPIASLPGVSVVSAPGAGGAPAEAAPAARARRL